MRTPDPIPHFLSHPDPFLSSDLCYLYSWCGSKTHRPLGEGAIQRKNIFTSARSFDLSSYHWMQYILHKIQLHWCPLRGTGLGSQFLKWYCIDSKLILSCMCIIQIYLQIYLPNQKTLHNTCLLLWDCISFQKRLHPFQSCNKNLHASSIPNLENASILIQGWTSIYHIFVPIELLQRWMWN